MSNYEASGMLIICIPLLFFFCTLLCIYYLYLNTFDIVPHLLSYLCYANASMSILVKKHLFITIHIVFNNLLATYDSSISPVHVENPSDTCATWFHGC